MDGPKGVAHSDLHQCPAEGSRCRRGPRQQADSRHQAAPAMATLRFTHMNGAVMAVSLATADTSTPAAKHTIRQLQKPTLSSQCGIIPWGRKTCLLVIH